MIARHPKMGEWLHVGAIVRTKDYPVKVLTIEGRTVTYQRLQPGSDVPTPMCRPCRCDFWHLHKANALSPCLVRDLDGENALHVVMPVRLD